MLSDFVITDICSVVSVSVPANLSEKSSFPADLPCNELIYSLYGEMTVRLGEQQFVTREGAVRFMPKNDYKVYDVVAKEDCGCIDIFFHSNKPVSQEAFITESMGDPAVCGLFKEINTLWTEKKENYYFKCMALLYEILASLDGNAGKNDKMVERIQPAVDYLNTHFTDPAAGCDGLGELCGISYSYLNKIFLNKFNLSPQKYLIHKRIEYASELLLSGRFSVAEIAQRCGYNNSTFFTRQFKKYKGITPGGFSRMNRSK